MVWPFFSVKSQPDSSTGLSRFHGGLKLPGNKQGLTSPIESINLPNQLILPLIDYQQRTLTPIVSVGQSVDCGETIAPGIVASSSGDVVAIEPRKLIHPSGDSHLCVVLAPDAVLASDNSAHPPAAAGGRPGNVSSLTPAVLQKMCISGLGGAGFPTAEKILSQQGARLNTLIINGAECEPNIACDEALILESAAEIIHGVKALADLTQCAECLIAIENTNQRAQQRLATALGNINDRRIRLVSIPSLYPTGAELPLIRILTDKTVPQGKRPADIGVLCINISTAFAAYQASIGIAMTSRVISITGSLATHPCHVRVPFGTPLLHVLIETGNLCNAENMRIRAGGPLSGFDIPGINTNRSAERKIDTTSAYPGKSIAQLLSLHGLPVTVHTNCISLESTNPANPILPCIRCGYCADVCPAELLPQQLYWYANNDDTVGTKKFNIGACIECGCCDLVCPSSIPLTQLFRHTKGVLKQQLRLQQESEKSSARYQQHESRIEQRLRVTSKTATSTDQGQQISDTLLRVRSRKKHKSRR